jgi:hypothetical protein
MSLDVYLISDNKEVNCVCPICSNSHTKEEHETYYQANITHNLNTMAKEAGIYKHLWRPEELNITKAKELIVPLEGGLINLKSRPEHFMRYNPANGWGDYDGLVSFVENYLEACKKYPEATIKISR